MNDRARPSERGPSRGWAFGFLLFACLALRVVGLFRPCLSDDEATYCVVGREMLSGRTLYGEVVDHKPPLIYLTYAATQALGGPTGGMRLLHLLTALVVFSTSLVLGRIRARPRPRPRRNERRRSAGGVVRGSRPLRGVLDDPVRFRLAGCQLRALHDAASHGLGADLPPRRGGPPAVAHPVGDRRTGGHRHPLQVSGRDSASALRASPDLGETSAPGSPDGGLGGDDGGTGRRVGCGCGHRAPGRCLGGRLVLVPIQLRLHQAGLSSVGVAGSCHGSRLVCRLAGAVPLDPGRPRGSALASPPPDARRSPADRPVFGWVAAGERDRRDRRWPVLRALLSSDDRAPVGPGGARGSTPRADPAATGRCRGGDPCGGLLSVGRGAFPSDGGRGRARS